MNASLRQGRKKCSIGREDSSAATSDDTRNLPRDQVLLGHAPSTKLCFAVRQIALTRLVDTPPNPPPPLFAIFASFCSTSFWYLPPGREKEGTEDRKGREEAAHVTPAIVRPTAT